MAFLTVGTFFCEALLSHPLVQVRINFQNCNCIQARNFSYHHNVLKKTQHLTYVQHTYPNTNLQCKAEQNFPLPVITMYYSHLY